MVVSGLLIVHLKNDNRKENKEVTMQQNMCAVSDVEQEIRWNSDKLPLRRCEKRHLNNGMFACIRAGSLKHIQHFVKCGADVLAVSKSGNNIMQEFMTSLKLPKDAWNDATFRPEEYLNKKQMLTYNYLSSCYEFARLLKQREIVGALACYILPPVYPKANLVAEVKQVSQNVVHLLGHSSKALSGVWRGFSRAGR